MVEETSLSTRKATILAANDTVIKNHGQMCVDVVEDSWKQASIHSQVADVSKTLASVRDLGASCHVTVLRSDAGYIKNVKSGNTVLPYTVGFQYIADLSLPSTPQNIDKGTINGNETHKL